ncbi:2-oxoacid:ferredoxin oxidoreductase subunit beta [Pelorhabdus rhamnosifermentans]|uniref:2-oxoacid:ferredoxin oxidoreductase subunit beta n=1 Tax=Pelorhabdus rhamnosifermentans TaxID=2772457 RepID=UPI001C060098|nr:2-oxoacid:ferredoxin oxidoreductase subunit beta [Pelorhabdus rhamnosifermentans]
MEEIVQKYYRQNHLPHMWCPGCGNGIVTSAAVKAIDKLQLSQDNTAIVSGIGCSSRASGYLDFDTVHTAHGRAIPFATGIKLANPKLNVIVMTGDGDATAIGGNHFIHAARRNINITVVLFNNSIYGMTGGQYSPLTPLHSKATTAPYGTIERSFDVVELAKAAGATFVARGTTYHAQQLSDVIAEAIAHDGFSLVEAITACPIGFGRQNKRGSGANMMKWQKEHAVTVGQASNMAAEQLVDKFVIGVLHKAEAPEYTKQYDLIIEQAQKGAK